MRVSLQLALKIDWYMTMGRVVRPLPHYPPALSPFEINRKINKHFNTNIPLNNTKRRRGRKRENEKERDQSTRFPGVLPIPSTMWPPIQAGVSAPTAAVGGWLWVHMRAPGCIDPSQKSELCTWDKEGKGGKKFEPTRGAKLVSGDARIP